MTCDALAERSAFSSARSATVNRMSHNAVLDPWDGQDVVPVLEVARAAGVPRYDVRKVELAGLIEHVGRENPGKGGRLLISHDDALFLLGVAALATAAGVALVTAARLFRESGAELGPDGFVVPIPAPRGVA